MNMKNLHHHLAEVDNTFCRVNCGGCACVAAMIAKRFRHQFPIMRITSSGTDCPTDLDEIRHHLDDTMDKDEWYDNGIYFNHVWVEVFFDNAWHVLDAEGVHTTEDMYADWSKPADGSFSIDEIQSLADTDSWNRAFDHDQLPAIEEMINNIPLEV